MKPLLAVTLFIMLTYSGVGQYDEYYSENVLRYEDKVYRTGIATVLLHREGHELTNPIIKLNSSEKLSLGFDDLDRVLTDFGYTFIHCNANWLPSNLQQGEFINGVPEDFITNYAYSRNTLQRYIHYSLVIPNETIGMAKSGNYILKVFDAAEPDSLVLTKRFMVTEDVVNVTAQIKPATKIEDRFYKQEVDFNITWRHYAITNPYDDLRVVVQQNHRWDNIKENLKPVFIKDRELVYDFDEENVFNGGNEFRFIDIKDIRYRAKGIAQIIRKDRYHVYMVPDKRRSSKVYLDDPDINGKRLIKVDDRFSEGHIDADYVYVHLSLPYHELLLKGDLYILGALSDWKLSSEYKMVFSDEKKAYQCTLYLKQGYYNYLYVFLPDGQEAGDETLIEGSHYETENEYTILVYHRSIGDDYDRLIAMESFNSRSNK